MKKLLGIVVLFLSLASCSENQNNKATSAIENCANDKFLKAGADPEFNVNKDLKKIFTEDKEIKKFNSQTKENNKLENKAKEDLYKFIEENFKNPKSLENKIYRIAVEFAYSDKFIAIFKRILTIKSEPLDTKLYSNTKFELRKKLSNYTSDFAKYKKAAYKSRLDEHNYKMSKFFKIDLKLRLFEKSFEKKFIRCENLRKKSPIAFDEKWKKN